MAIVAFMAIFSSAVMGQACKSTSEIPSSTPSSRFDDHGDGTVTDKQTGLMWAKYHETQTSGPYTVNWNTALARAESSSLASYTNWRLPNIKELLTIVEVRCESPALNSQVFPATGTVVSYWSSTPTAVFSSAVWVVNFEHGTTSYPDRDNYYFVRLVRDP